MEENCCLEYKGHIKASSYDIYSLYIELTIFFHVPARSDIFLSDIADIASLHKIGFAAGRLPRTMGLRIQPNLTCTCVFANSLVQHLSQKSPSSYIRLGTNTKNVFRCPHTSCCTRYSGLTICIRRQACFPSGSSPWKPRWP